MKRFSLAFCALFLSLILPAQINLVGHTMINSSPVKQVNVIVKTDGVVTKTLNTQSKSEFKLQLDHGKVYDVYCQHSKSPVMHLRVMGTTVPKEKQSQQMGYELTIPFVYKTDEDIDTTVFKDPFFKIVFDGNKKLTDDTTYNNAFAKTVIRKTKIPGDGSKKMNAGPATITGKVFLNGNPHLTVKHKAISIYNKSGQVIKTTYTNRFGAFVFTGLSVAEVAKIQVEANDITGDNTLSLATSKNTIIKASKPAGGTCEWELSNEEIITAIDNYFTTNIGGKLVSSSSKEKKFYAKKEVYLLNEYNTIIRKTTTNPFGTFVFADLKPDHRYFIGIDAAGVSGQRVDLLSKEDNFLGSLDSSAAGKRGIRIVSNYNKVFNNLSIDEDEMKMDIKATIYGDNVNTPIGKLKIILLNDNYEVIDSAVTDDFGTFKFKYLPFLKRFYLSAENTDNILDVFKNIIIYSNDDNLIKIMTHQKGSKFNYKPMNAEISSMQALELEDPWLELLDSKKEAPLKRSFLDPPKKSIVENVLFENGKYDITPQAKEILDKVILVLNTNKNLKLEAGAHTDSKGSEASNMKLSQMRSKTVQDYITKAGIDAKRVITKGYGETKLLNNCADNVPCTELEHAQNRRIEFKILGE